ncbi:sulfite exporter TauE/SafE family protein, partial [Mycolicibacter arupensis]
QVLIIALGLVAGAGGLVGGYLGARLSPRLPEAVLRIALGAIATATGALYVLQSL